MSRQPRSTWVLRLPMASYVHDCQYGLRPPSAEAVTVAVWTIT
ncbi:hypothetical protein [Dactylosporangium salmoneum]